MNVVSSGTSFYRMRPVWSANQISMFTMTNKPGGGSKNSLLTSLPMYLKYADASLDDIPFERMSFAMKDGTTSQDQIDLVNDLKDAMYMTSNYVTYKTFDNSQYDKIDRIVDIIFDIIIVITMFLSFFSLSASMGANIFEMSKEIGVLRSLGFTKTRIKILFIYESFILVLASSFLGVLIGLFVGVSMMI